MAAVLKSDPKPPSQVVEGIPRDLERIILRCLRKDPARRFQHVTDLKVDLEELKETTGSGESAPPAAKTTRPKQIVLDRGRRRAAGGRGAVVGATPGKRSNPPAA